jgi:murein L,D-transpeptidase YcbB/YkuD
MPQVAAVSRINGKFQKMRPMRRFGGAAGAAALAMLLTGAALVQQAEAQQGDKSWMRSLGPGYTGGSGTGDYSEREFIRDWEMHPAKGVPTLSAANLGPTKAAIARYAEIVAKGGWRKLPNVKLELGTTHPAVVLLRKRLRLSGELEDDGSTSEYFDYDLDQAVRRYQTANGLAPTGVVDKATATAMNVPAASRLKQLRTNLTRLGELAKTPAKYVAVNIPAAQIEAVENGAVVSRHAGIVGKIDRATPLLRSSIQQLNFNAVWHLPPTVINEDLIPTGQKMARRGESVLVKFKIDAYSGGRKLEPRKIDWSGSDVKNLVYRQQPGPENPLGFVKINFPNAHSVYMHDTPKPSLFGRSFRAASSGCVRIAGIEHLVTWIVSEEGWKLDDVRRMKETGERRDVKLKRAIPLYFAYVTAWATPGGGVHFRRDIYLKDDIGKQAGAY